MMLVQSLAGFAKDRLDLSRRERIRFRLAPQISLEILLILAAEHGSAPLTALFERIAAAEKSVRTHVRALMASGLIEERQDLDDKRAKRLILTDRGIEDLTAHMRESRGPFEVNGSMRARSS